LLAIQVPGAAGTQHPIVFARYSVAVAGGTALGYLAYPTDVVPTTLLVVAHGCCIAIGSWSASLANSYYRMSAWAATYGIAIVGMDYSGPGHWDVAAGARDTLAATLDLRARWNITRTILWGASMGGEVSGMAAAARPDLFDYWVDQYGVADLQQEFTLLGSLGTDASKVGSPGSSWILDETGGLPTGPSDPAWAARSPVVLAAGMQGLRHAYLAHGVGDTLVPVAQALQMHDALVRAGVPVTLHLATTGANARDGGVEGPYVPPLGAPVVPTPEGHTVAGHNTLGAAEAFAFLYELLAGREPDAGRADTVQVVDYHACWVHDRFSPAVACRATLP
jgi:pimeloyl-ACP methyl ester carboxylesterase